MTTQIKNVITNVDENKIKDEILYSAMDCIKMKIIPVLLLNGSFKMTPELIEWLKKTMEYLNMMMICTIY